MSNSSQAHTGAEAGAASTGDYGRSDLRVATKKSFLAALVGILMLGLVGCAYSAVPAEVTMPRFELMPTATPVPETIARCRKGAVTTVSGEPAEVLGHLDYEGQRYCVLGVGEPGELDEEWDPDLGRWIEVYEYGSDQQWFIPIPTP